jgi:hypothetical protein
MFSRYLKQFKSNLALSLKLQSGIRSVAVRSMVDLPALRKTNHTVIKDLSEYKQREIFHQNLRNGAPASVNSELLKDTSLTPDEIKLIIKASMSTFLVHVEARIASSVGQGFYTIGPCGEELLSTVGLLLKATDPTALHYRHVGTSIMRQLLSGKSIEDILLDRARGYACSTQDPVTGGRHCAIGGSSYDFLVTSTLASQCTPAVGRAQAIPLVHMLKVPSPFPKDSVSYVSLGDGSTNNGHFLSALNLAEYSTYHKIKVRQICALKRRRS